MMRNDHENFLDTTASEQLNRAEKRSFSSSICEIVQLPPTGPLALLPTQAQGVPSAVASDVSSEADCKVRCGIRAGGEWYCEIECSWQF